MGLIDKRSTNNIAQINIFTQKVFLPRGQTAFKRFYHSPRRAGTLRKTRVPNVRTFQKYDAWCSDILVTVTKTKTKMIAFTELKTTTKRFS